MKSSGDQEPEAAPHPDRVRDCVQRRENTGVASFTRRAPRGRGGCGPGDGSRKTTDPDDTRAAE
jgi:hypothetical protein